MRINGIKEKLPIIFNQSKEHLKKYYPEMDYGTEVYEMSLNNKKNEIYTFDCSITIAIVNKNTEIFPGINNHFSFKLIWDSEKNICYTSKNNHYPIYNFLKSIFHVAPQYSL